MKNFEIPLKAVTDEVETIALAHKLLDGMNKSEYFEKAPDVDPSSVTPYEFFRELEGDDWEARKSDMNIKQQVSKIPKGYDVALAFAMEDGQFDRAKRILGEMLDLEIANNEVQECTEYFDNFEEREALYRELATLETNKKKDEIFNELWKS